MSHPRRQDYRHYDRDRNYYRFERERMDVRYHDRPIMDRQMDNRYRYYPPPPPSPYYGQRRERYVPPQKTFHKPMWNRPVEKERPSIIRKETVQPPVVSSSSESSDEDGFDQDQIEEQIDRIDNEITKQERTLAQLQSQMQQEQSSVSAQIVVSKLSNSKANVTLGGCVMEPWALQGNPDPPASFDSLVDQVYEQNRKWISQVQVKQLDRDFMVFNLSNPESNLEPCFDPTIWDKELVIKPKTREAIVAFLRAKKKQTFMEMDKRVNEYKTLKQRYMQKVGTLEKEMEKLKQVQVQQQQQQPRRRGMGFGKGDVVRTDQEWEKALAMLGIEQQKDIYAKEVVMLPRSDLERRYVFENNNDIVVDPEQDLKQFNKEQETKWSDHDRQLFRALLSTHGKDFFKIANNMDGRGKTTQDCIWYYYKEKQNARFKNMLRRKKRKETYDGKSDIRVYELESDEGWEIKSESEEEIRESSGGLGVMIGQWTWDQLDKLKSAQEEYGFDFSMIAQKVGKTAPVCRLALQLLKKGDDILGITEKRRKKKKKKEKEDVEMSRQTVESADELDQEPKEMKDQNTKETTPNPIEKEGKKKRKRTATSEDETRRTVSYWSVSERNSFVTLLQTHGRDWEMIANELGTKSAIQVRNYYVNAKRRGELDDVESNTEEESRIPKIRFKVNTESVQVEIVKPEKKMSIMSMLNSDGLDALVDAALSEKAIPIPENQYEPAEEAYEPNSVSNLIHTTKPVSFASIANEITNHGPAAINSITGLPTKVTLIHLAPSSVASNDGFKSQTEQESETEEFQIDPVLEEQNELEEGEMQEDFQDTIGAQIEESMVDEMSVVPSQVAMETDNSMVESIAEESRAEGIDMQDDVQDAIEETEMQQSETDMQESGMQEQVSEMQESIMEQSEMQEINMEQSDTKESDMQMNQ